MASMTPSLSKINFHYIYYLAVIGICLAVYVNKESFLNGEDPEVVTRQGRIRGKTALTRNGRVFHEFLGIPFAEPPVGRLRFQSPVPASSWNDTLIAKQFKKKCLQIDLITHLRSGDDDCLYLNVFVPEVDPSLAPLPVMFYIHGGFYVSGAAKLYRGKYLMDKNIILVTIQYRLGALGFLNADNELARGNMGLKDQVLALKWVQENIDAFGGDRNRVTIFGQSAGGSSVHMHLVSPMSKGLFHRAITHSGTIMSPWAYTTNSKAQSIRLGRQLGCPTNDSIVMVECLKKLDARVITEIHRECLSFTHDPLSVFKPTIESFKDHDAFLTENPMELIKSGKIVNKVPWILGVNKMEGSAVATVIVREPELLKQFDENWEEQFSNLLFYPIHDTEKSNKIRQKYFGDSEDLTHEDHIANFINMFSEREYFVGTHHSARIHAKHAPTYLFYFAKPAPLSFGQLLSYPLALFHPAIEIGIVVTYQWILRNIFGIVTNNIEISPSHADDMTFLFNIPLIPEYEVGEDYTFSEKMVNLWVSFAQNGYPDEIDNVKWKTVNASDPTPKYLKISHVSEMIDEPFNNGVKFWDSLGLSFS